jgi:hypothetical protein
VILELVKPLWRLADEECSLVGYCRAARMRPREALRSADHSAVGIIHQKYPICSAHVVNNRRQDSPGMGCIGPTGARTRERLMSKVLEIQIQHNSVNFRGAC